MGAADAFLWLVRGQGVRVAIAGEHETMPDILEVYSPVTSPWHPAEVRWTGFRDASGVWMDDIETGDRHGPGTMAQMLAEVERTMELERAEAISHIPVALVRTVGALLGD
jgi:hypothetical protein